VKENMKDQTTIKLELSGVTLERFKAIKDFFGLNRSPEVLRRLISERYDKLQHAARAILPMLEDL